MRFLVDMPFSPELAQWLRAEGHDAVHASTLSLTKLPMQKFCALPPNRAASLSLPTLTSQGFWLPSALRDRA